MNALEALEYLYNCTSGDGWLQDKFCEEWKHIIEKELKALEIIKRVFSSSSIYGYKLKDSLECGWITEEEHSLLNDVIQGNPTGKEV